MILIPLRCLIRVAKYHPVNQSYDRLISDVPCHEDMKDKFCFHRLCSERLC